MRTDPAVELGNRRRMRVAMPSIARYWPGPVLGKDAHLMLPSQSRVLGYDPASVLDANRLTDGEHLHGLADEPERHRIPVGLEAHQVVVGNDARQAPALTEGTVSGDRHQRAALLDEAFDRPHVRSAVDALVGDRGIPLVELRLHIEDIDEAPAGQEVPLQVLHARLHLALGLRPVRRAQPRLEAPVPSEGAEGLVPAPLAAHRLAHRPA